MSPVVFATMTYPLSFVSRCFNSDRAVWHLIVFSEDDVLTQLSGGLPQHLRVQQYGLAQRTRVDAKGRHVSAMRGVSFQ